LKSRPNAHDYECPSRQEETSLYEAGPTRLWLKVKQQGWTIGKGGWRRGIFE
jgi:hypothetical protein